MAIILLLNYDAGNMKLNELGKAPQLRTICFITYFLCLWFWRSSDREEEEIGTEVGLKWSFVTNN